MEAHNAELSAQSAQSDIREEDKALAVRLSTSKLTAQAAELLQLAAIYAALPEERRTSWFDRLGAFGVSPALREQIVERARTLIRFPDWRSGERLRREYELRRERRGLADERRRPTDR